MNDLFDIRILTSIEGTPFEPDKDGAIYVVGNRSALSDRISNIRNTVIGGMDKSNSYNFYRICVKEQPESFNDLFGWNIICPIEDPASGTKLYIIASYNDDDLEMVVSAIINEAETQMRKFLEEALVKAAIKDPEGFKSAVDKVIIDSNDDGGGVGNGHGSPFGVSIGAVFSAPLSLGLGLDMDMDIEDACSVEGDESSYREAAIGLPKKSSGRQELHKVSAKDRKIAFSNLPERISEAYMKDNVMYAEIVDETFASYSADEMRALLRELCKKHKNLYRSAYDTSLQGVTKYELVLHPWSIKYSKEFKKRTNYRYYLYLKDSKGNERPIIFKHNPSFCIYVMYMVDRFNRKENVTDLSIRTMEKEFSTVYKTIMNESDEKILDLFRGMSSRTTKTGSLRDGRYGEYIKDIHQTFEGMMDNVNSMPFKVGFGRYLQVPPEKMTIPQNLAKLKIV